ncbi:MAG: Methionine aminopeptidase [Chlamydiae bacterium]|nr:Methionine aminopeptidase [Chlamydiota bacterium]
MIGRNDLCFCGSGKKWKKCHYPQTISEENQLLKNTYLQKYNILIKDSEQIEKIKKACMLCSKVLDLVCQMAKAGTTTKELDLFVKTEFEKQGAISAAYHYGSPPFPANICTSLNEVICHGIPDETPLKEGDIFNLDVACILDGYFGDCSKMVCVGKVDANKKRVVECAYFSLMEAIKTVQPKSKIHEIGDAIESVAKEYKCSVVYQFVGHGVGIQFHEGPEVPHHANKSIIECVPGMIFTIEPMINLGKKEGEIDPINHWTVRTVDRLASAQYEHTLLVTDTGCEILTPWEKPDFAQN